MAIEAIITPEFFGDVTVEETEHFGMYYNHDIVVGRLILARSVFPGQFGKVVILDGYHEDPRQIERKDMFDLTNDSRLFYAKLLPYVSILLATHEDNGEPANLSLRHQPSRVPIVGMEYLKKLD